MASDLDPIDVAAHWPLVRRHLHLERWPTAGEVLDCLAAEQLVAGGGPVVFGTAYWRRLELNAGHATQTLRKLEQRGVVISWDHRGRRGHGWSLSPDLGRWRRMPWTVSGRRLVTLIRACGCRAPRAVVAVLPGQSVALSRATAQIRLSEADHLRRPGLFPVETDYNGARRATTAYRPGPMPVEARDNGAGSGPLHLVSENSSNSLPLEDEEEGFASLLKGHTQAADGQALWGDWETQLRDLAKRAGPRAFAIAARVGRLRGQTPWSALQVIRQYVEHPELLDDHPSVVASMAPEARRAGEQLRVLERSAAGHRAAGEEVPPELAAEIARWRAHLATLEG